LGTIRDATDAVLPGVTVTVINQASGQARQVITDSDGTYAALLLPVGEYEIRAELAGFNTLVRRGVVLQVGQKFHLDLTLAVGQVNEQVTVQESAPLLNTSSAEVAEVIANQRLVDLPINGRLFVNLTALSDNIVIEARGTRGAALGQTGSSFAVAGQRGGHNVYWLDGVVITDEYFNNLVISPSVEAIQEFKIQKSMYAAEYGGKAAANINAITKSGTNDLHGTVYEFLRNDIFDARNFFDRATKPALRQNQFGVTIGGPAIKDRTFYFANYEGFRELRGQTQTFSVPSLNVRNGDFSGLAAIYDPATLSGGQRQPFPANRIPTARLDPAAVAFLQKIPLPNQPGEVQNYVASPRLKNYNDQFGARLDHRFDTRNTFFARYTWARLDTFRPVGSTDLNEVLVPGFGYSVATRVHNIALSSTHIYNPRLIQEFRVGYLRVTGGQHSENHGLDFNGQNGIQGLERDPRKFGYPAITFAGAYTNMGDPATLVSRKNNSYDFVTNLSWIHGPHNMKFGGYLFHLQFNPYDPTNARGTFNFTPRYTSSAPGLSNGNAFADFLLGYPSSASGGIGRGEEDARTNWLHLYAQDDWRVNDRLTFNYGLRYEINQQMKETQNRISNIELNRFVIASDDAGNIHPDATALLPLIPIPYVTSKEAGYDRSLMRPSYKRIAPRVGLAWSLDQKTVVRAGAGVFHNQWAYSVQTVLMKNLPFYFNKSVTTAADTSIPTLSTRNILLSPATGTIGGAGVDYNFRTELAQSWTLGIQRTLAKDLAAEVSYFGSHLIGADDNTLENVPRPGAGPIDPRRPNPRLSSFQVLHWGGWTWYHSGTVKVDKRYSAGLGVNANYTWSKSIDPASSPGATFFETNLPQDPSCRACEKALSSFDHRHRLVFSTTYQLPAGQGYSYNPSGVLGTLLSGWTVSGIGTFQTGAPFSVNLPSDNANTGNGPNQRPNVLRDPNLKSGKTPERWFDTSAFEMPAQFTYGNAGRNIVYADGNANFDFSLAKEFRIREAKQLEFRAEVFNLTNHTNFDQAPGRTAFTANFGRYFSALNPRQMQFGLRLMY
jgi:hypothetical protein